MARADAAIFPRELLHDCLTRALNEGATITDEASALEYADSILSWSRPCG
ncbi:hypothetical protein ACLK1S_16975 [Escherichia coli]